MNLNFALGGDFVLLYCGIIIVISLFFLLRLGYQAGSLRRGLRKVRPPQQSRLILKVGGSGSSKNSNNTAKT